MERTFAMRRNDILTHGHSYDPLVKYPFLQDKEYVSVINVWLIHVHVIYSCWLSYNVLLGPMLYLHQNPCGLSMLPKLLLSRR